jgi:hypothetical protein
MHRVASEIETCTLEGCGWHVAWSTVPTASEGGRVGTMVQRPDREDLTRAGKCSGCGREYRMTPLP